MTQPIDPAPCLAALADIVGVAREYTHAGGWSVTTPEAQQGALLTALGYPADDDAAIANSLARAHRFSWGPGLPTVHVHHDPGPCMFPFVHDATQAPERLAITLVNEDGTEQTFTLDASAAPVSAEKTLDGHRVIRRLLTIPASLAYGYHRLIAGEQSMVLIVPPHKGYLPPGLSGTQRVWGFSVQLYGLRSAKNWGHGTFGDLSAFIDLSAELGAGIVGVNPLHALFPTRPNKRCPYAPSSRYFLNPLYIDISAVPELANCPELRTRIASPGFTEALDRIKDGDLIDYPAVAAAIVPALRELYATFRDQAGSARRAEFEAFRICSGNRLRSFAIYEALVQHFQDQLPESAGTHWERWPPEYRHPNSAAVTAFADQHADEITFREFLQFEADRQLGLAGQAAKRRMSVGLYRDLAVGFDRDGADAWIDQELVPPGVSVGCPPDLRNPLGQDWGVAPWHPHTLKAQAFQPFIDLLRANMRHASALRIDHAFQLQRLFLIPFGSGAQAGGYVHFPLDDLLAIVALESRRNRCLVIAEDLGTIPEGFREKAMAAGTFSYRVLHRERAPDRSYLPPEAYPIAATAVQGTHDQATLTGFWMKRDVETRQALNLYPTPEAEAAAGPARDVDKQRLMEALWFDPKRVDGYTRPDGSPAEEIVLATHRFLGRTNAKLVTVNPDDLVGAIDQANLPATVDEFPNWRRRMPVPIEEFGSHPMVATAAAILTDERDNPSDT